MSQTVMPVPYEPAGIAGRGGPPRGTPRWLIGCLGLLAGFALLLGGLTVGLMIWAIFPGDQVDTLAAIGPRTTLALHLRDEPGHPGVDGLLDRIGAHMGELDAARKRARLPEDARWLQDLQQRKTADADALRFVLPSEVTLALDGEGEEAALVVLNPHHLVRPMRAMFVAMAKPGTLHEVGDAVWMQTGDSTLGALEGTVVWAPSAAQMEAGLDRLALEPGSGAAHPAVRRALTPLAARWHLSLYAEAPADELRRRAKAGLALLDGDRARRASAEASPSPRARLALGASLLDEDTLEGELRIEADDPAAAASLLEAARATLGELVARGAGYGLTLSWREGDAPGVLTLRCTGLSGFVDATFTRLAEEMEARERRR